MLILSLDTSADICSVALFDSERELVTYRFRHERRLSERLPSVVEFLLLDANTTLANVEAFAVGLGPGSFTGVRVGVTLAKTWAQVLERPLIGVSSLDALAMALPPVTGGIVAAVAPTRRDEVVAAFYRVGDPMPATAPAVVRSAEIEAAARAAIPDRNGPLFLVGEVAEAVAGAVKQSETVGEIVVRTAVPDAADVARLAARRLVRGESDDPLGLTPLYVTPPPVRGPDGKLLTPV